MARARAGKEVNVELRPLLGRLRPLRRFVLLAIAIELTLLLAELILVRVVGQRGIAAAMITAPKSPTALLGALAILARISAHALFPALCAFLLARKLASRLLS